MNLFVLLKMVPDVVEELEIAPDGKSLDLTWLRMKPSETDEHALEQALILKERHGGSVTVLALEEPEIDEVLYTALAKGADRVVKIVGEWWGVAGGIRARVLADVIRALPPPNLILTGTQAIDDLDGELAPRLAWELNLPYLGVVTGVHIDPGANRITAIKEFAGGLRGEFQLPMPAVLGIQAAERSPRYVPVAKVRQVMRTGHIETLEAPVPTASPLLQVLRMFKPEVAREVQWLEGSPEEIAEKIADLLSERGLI